MALRTDANTRMLAWDAKLREDSLTQDIFSDFMGVMTEKARMIPEAVRVKVPGVKKGEYSRTLSLLKALNGSGVTGRTSQLGNEEEQTQKTLKVYANSYSNAVNLEQYGIDGWQMKFYDIAAKVQPQLSRWHKEIEGKHIREALCEKYSSNLEVAPTSLTAAAHPNIFIVDTAESIGGLEPTYSATAATYAQNIATKMQAVGTYDSTNRLTQETLNDIQAWATQTKEIEPLIVGGKPTYILTVPTRQKRFLMDPTDTDSFATTLKDADVRGSNNRLLDYSMGRYGMLLLVEDPRHPIATGSGSSVSFAYKGAGSTDGRSFTAGDDICDVAMLLGKGAVFTYDMEPLHFEEEIQDYRKNKGVGAFRTCGEIRADFDDVTPDATSVHNKSSALIFCGTN